MTNDTEPRALGAALAAPAFVTRNHGVAMHTANRHVERWAPEADAGRVRSLHSLGFVDRLVAPWMETAQRSASLHLFSGYAAHGLNEGAGRRVSWVFPRPWYQDELDWMAAARQSSTQSVSRQVAPTLLTTRGTYVPSASAPASAPPVAMPSALYEHVAPSLSLDLRTSASANAGSGFGLNARLGAGFGAEAPSREAYSPLISLAAVQAAELMSRAVAPLATQRAGATATSVSPGLRSVLTTILERAAMSRGAELQPLRISQSAPHLETPPAPRAADLPGVAAGATFFGRESVAAAESSGSAASAEAAAAGSTAARVAQQYAEQRAQLAELQRFAHQSAQRDAAARAEAAAAAARTQAAEQAAAAPGRPTPADAQASARATAQTAEVRAAAERAERELRQRAGSTRASEAQRQAQAADAERVAAERARIDERVAQRIAERTGTQRLHEQARADAAAHARALADMHSMPDASPAHHPAFSAAFSAASSASAPSADVAAAIAGLPPELSAMVGSAVNRRPERAMQAIAELGDALRTVELLARSSAAGAAFEAIRGPRLVMPAGLGGLVNAVDRAQTMTAGPVMLDEQRQVSPLAAFGAAGPLAPSGQFVELGQPAFAPRAAARDARVPTLSWLQAAAPARATASAGAMAGSSALGAATTASPAALSHVAWADRWLARFAGAAPQSLDMISAAGAATPSARMQSLANAAPGVVFVVPDFLRGDVVPRSAVSPAMPPLVIPASAASAPFASASAVDRPDLRLINAPPSEPVLRFDDSAETPDEVFAAISAAASRGRGPAGRRSETPGSAARAAQAAAQAEQAAQAAQSGERARLADLVAHSAPAAPGAGLSAQLASSPFAPALRHVLPLPSAVSFDVRSLFGAGLGATYLAGLVGPALRELEIGAQTVPTWASWSEAPLNQQLGQPFGPLGGDPSYRLDRQIPAFDAAYVTPAAEARELTEGEMSGVSGERTAAMPATAALPGAATPQVQGGFVPPAGSLGAAPGMAAEAATAFADRGAGTALTTLRSALLSWDLATSELGAPQLVPTSFAAAPAGASGWSASSGAYRAASPQSSVTARMMIEAMSMPMLGETAEQPAAWAAPGMIADRAHTWSVAQERSASDLSLDFVTPELVLAARVYGLGPAEAAQAARLAIAGPGQLGAMASAVDRTFVEAMAIGREARTMEAARARGALAQDGGASRDAARAAITTAFPTGDGGIAAAIGPTAGLPAGAASTAADPVGTAGTIAGLPDAAAGVSATATAAGPGLSTAQPAFSNALFGVDRRAPRGAFLWPSSAVAALGMTALGADGQLSASVAALELLAAQVVAELGTYTALSEVDAATRAAAGELDGPGAFGASPETLGSPSRSGAALFGAGTPMSSGVLGDASPGFGAPGLLGAASAAGVAARSDAGQLGLGVEPGEADVLGAAAALVPASRRARFDALYVALGQSTAGRSWSPAARAARALALAGRSDDTMTTARERAASAWDVLPVVYASGAGESSIDGAGGAAGSTAGSPASSAAAAAMMSSVVAPGAFGGSTTVGARSGAARAQRGRGAGSRDVVGADSGHGGWDEGADMPPVSAPGLAGLSARAGDALGAYVAPAAPPSAPMQQSSETAGAVLRAPTAAPEYVQTGRSGGRHGGGEVEIPPWFEAAARRMLSERSGGDGISLAELTLVTAAPSSHIAAATISQPSTASAGPSGGSTASGAPPPKIDIEKLAYELFRDIMVMMDVARARNGDPFQ